MIYLNIFFLFQNSITCYSDIQNIENVFRRISSQLNNNEKHFKSLKIQKDKRNNFITLNSYSFWDIKFDEFYGENIRLIHNNAFSNATETIKLIKIQVGYVSHIQSTEL